jgi:hypothetical protein
LHKAHFGIDGWSAHRKQKYALYPQQLRHPTGVTVRLDPLKTFIHKRAAFGKPAHRS